MPKKLSKKRLATHTLRIVIAAAAFYFAFAGQDPARVGKVLLNVDLHIFAAAALLHFAAQMVFVCRWRVLLGAQKIHIDFLPALKLHLLGLFYNNCLPGSIGGDVLRSWYATKHTEKKIEAVLSVFVDRTVGLVCTLIIVFGSWWLIPAENSGLELTAGNFNPGPKLTGLLPVIAAAGVVFVLVILTTLAVPKGRVKLRMLAAKLKHIFFDVLTAFRIYLASPLAFAAAAMLAFVCQAMTVLGFWLIGRNLGIDAHIKYYFMFFPLSWVIGVIPISVGGAGVMELGIKGMFARVTNVTALQGLVLGLAQRVILLVVSVPGFIVHITGRHLPERAKIRAEIKGEN